MFPYGPSCAVDDRKESRCRQKARPASSTGFQGMGSFSLQPASLVLIETRINGQPRTALRRFDSGGGSATAVIVTSPNTCRSRFLLTKRKRRQGPTNCPEQIMLRRQFASFLFRVGCNDGFEATTLQPEQE
jgi:hypothetical protein